MIQLLSNADPLMGNLSPHSSSLNPSTYIKKGNIANCCYISFLFCSSHSSIMHRSRNKTREKVKPISNYVLFACYDLNRNLRANIVWLTFSCDYLSRPSPIHHLKHFCFLEEDLLSISYLTRNHSMQAFQTTPVIAPTDQARASHQNHGQAHAEQPKFPPLCTAPHGRSGTAGLKCRGLDLWLLGRLARDLDYIYLIINLPILYCDLILEQ